MMQYFTPPAGKLPNRKTTITIAIGALIVFFLGTTVFIVNPAEQAVITRFGKYLTTKDPGLQFKLPFGIDKCQKVNVRAVQTEQFSPRSTRGGRTVDYPENVSEATMLTGDLNIVNVEWIIQYRIDNPRSWLFNVNDRERTIRDVSRSVINMLVGDRAIMDIMSPERSAIEIAGADIMNETFRRYDLGINVIVVKLQNVGPPAGVREAFEDVNKAIQDMNRLINEGQQVYNEAIPKVRGEADRLVQQALGYEIERENRANGDVARFNAVYNEYRNSPEVTRQRLYYEMIEEVFKDEEGMTVIDRNLRNFLPLMNMGGNQQGGNR